MANAFEENDMTPDLYTLVDEDGVEQQFEMLDCMEVDDTTYYALVPYNENPEELLNENDELVILKAAEENGEEILATIDDEDEYNKVGEMFLARLNELFGEDEE